MPRAVHPPVRREEIVSHARYLRKKYQGVSIDKIAQEEGILLQRIEGPKDRGGQAIVLRSMEDYVFESLSRPGSKIRSLVKEMVLTDCIIINPSYKEIEKEIFWHEYYHLWYSTQNPFLASSKLVHTYSMLDLLDKQEERRANEFAATILIPKIFLNESAIDITNRYNVSQTLAFVAMAMRRTTYKEKR